MNDKYFLYPLTIEEWELISDGEDYTVYCDLRMFIGCIDYLMNDRIYRVKVN